MWISLIKGNVAVRCEWVYTLGELAVFYIVGGVAYFELSVKSVILQTKLTSPVTNNKYISTRL